MFGQSRLKTTKTRYKVPTWSFTKNSHLFKKKASMTFLRKVTLPSFVFQLVFSIRAQTSEWSRNFFMLSLVWNQLALIDDIFSSFLQINEKAKIYYHARWESISRTTTNAIILLLVLERVTTLYSLTNVDHHRGDLTSFRGVTLPTPLAQKQQHQNEVLLLLYRTLPLGRLGCRILTRHLFCKLIVTTSSAVSSTTLGSMPMLIFASGVLLSYRLSVFVSKFHKSKAGKDNGTIISR